MFLKHINQHIRMISEDHVTLKTGALLCIYIHMINIHNIHIGLQKVGKFPVNLGNFP